MSTANGRGGRRLTIFLSVTVVLLVALGAFAAFWFLGERTVEGMVLDGTTTQPLPNARVEVGGQTVTTDANGHFSIPGVRPGLRLDFAHEGYHSASILLGNESQVEAKLEPYVLHGIIVDATTGSPIAGAAVRLGPQTAATEATGEFGLTAVAPGSPVVVEAPGYQSSTFSFQPDRSGSVALQPNLLRIQVVDAQTGQPLGGASVQMGSETQIANHSGEVSVPRLLPGTALTVSAPGFASSSLAYNGQAEAKVELRSDAVAGTITDPNGRPVAGATVSTGTVSVTSDSAGRFSLNGLPPDHPTLTIRKEGYAPARVDVKPQHQLDLTLKPGAVRALYLTYYGVGSDELLNNALSLIQTTEANALVIDIKGDRGWIAYQSGVPMVAQIGAQQVIMLPDVDRFVQQMHQRGVYLIARIVTFKDNPLATAHPEWAVHDTITGGLWIDNEGLAWTDAFHEEVWDYNIALAVEAAQHGFDEVQFDYVRFPTDASANTSVDRIGLAEDNSMANRVHAISGFLKKAKDALQPYGAVLAADIFGYVCWRTDDMGIGQYLETLGQIVDVISPMVYPTLYWDGIPVSDGPSFSMDAPAHPYEIVQQSLKRASERLKEAGAHAVLRPWLQYYNDYILDIPYGDHEIRVQKLATYENGIKSWMFWDPSNRYSKGGFDPKN